MNIWFERLLQSGAADDIALIRNNNTLLRIFLLAKWKCKLWSRHCNFYNDYSFCFNNKIYSLNDLKFASLYCRKIRSNDVVGELVPEIYREIGYNTKQYKCVEKRFTTKENKFVRSRTVHYMNQFAFLFICDCCVPFRLYEYAKIMITSCTNDKTNLIDNKKFRSRIARFFDATQKNGWNKTRRVRVNCYVRTSVPYSDEVLQHAAIQVESCSVKPSAAAKKNILIGNFHLQLHTHSLLVVFSSWTSRMPNFFNQRIFRARKKRTHFVVNYSNCWCVPSFAHFCTKTSDVKVNYFVGKWRKSYAFVFLSSFPTLQIACELKMDTQLPENVSDKVLFFFS